MQEIHTANSTVDRNMGTVIISEEIFTDKQHSACSRFRENKQSSKSGNDFF